MHSGIERKQMTYGGKERCGGGVAGSRGGGGMCVIKRDTHGNKEREGKRKWKKNHAHASARAREREEKYVHVRLSDWVME